ncbi:MAG: EamA family transporter [Saprospiraceae bacterium]|nr:EamA family transporter [Candidatus Brachybacter algidus]
MDNKKAWIALGIICIIWGTTYLFLKIGVHEMAPFLFSGIRQVTAGILLFIGLRIFLRLEKPSLENVLKQSAAGILMITVGNGLVAYGEVSIPSSLAAVICASMPVWVSLINLVTPGAIKLTWVGYLSILLGVCGIFWLFSTRSLV